MTQDQKQGHNQGQAQTSTPAQTPDQVKAQSHFRNRALGMAAMLACLTLTACGNDGPSDAAIRKAVRAEATQAAIQMNQMNNDLNGSPFGNAQPGYKALPTDHLTPAEQARLAKLKIQIGAKTRQSDGSYAVIVTVAGQTSSMTFIHGANGWQAEDGAGS